MSGRTTKSQAEGEGVPASSGPDIAVLSALVKELRSAIVESRAATQATAEVSRELFEALLKGRRKPRPGAPGARQRVVPPRGATVESAREAGQTQLVAWVEEGALMPSEQFAANWGMTPQGLQKAAARGELAPIKVSNRIYYPAVLCALPRPFAIGLGQAMRALSPAQQLIFLLRRHGALDGKSIGELTTTAQQARALELARGWAAEELDAA